MLQKERDGAVVRCLLQEVRRPGGVCTSTGPDQVLVPGFYPRADSSPVFERCVRKEGCHPINGRTPALGLKSLHNMTNFFAQLLFPASRGFVSAPQIS